MLHRLLLPASASQVAAVRQGVTATSTSALAAASRQSTRHASTSSSSAASLSSYPAGRTRHILQPQASSAVSNNNSDVYSLITRDFTWPHEQAKVEYYNIGVDICDKWAMMEEKKDSPALLYEDSDNGGDLLTCTFSQAYTLSSRLCHALTSRLQLKRTDRVAILMSQSIETALVHMSVYKCGGITVPLFILFGPDALEYRLNDSAARIVFVEQSKLDEILALKAAGKIPQVKHIVVAPPLSAMKYETMAVAGGKAASAASSSTSSSSQDTQVEVHHLSSLLSSASSSPFTPVATRLDDPALIIYTSGTTGNPKGALHAHRALLGHLPGVEFPHEFFPQRDDLMWTPADWSWIGGLCDVLLPSLHHGIPVYACRFSKFDPDLAFRLIEKRNIRNMFLPPTALKLMRTVENAHTKYPHMKVRSIGSGGESLGESLLSWGRRTFSGININEFYGQTECNLVIGNCSSAFPPKEGSMGRAIPGHQVDIVNDDGIPLADGEVGNIGIKKGHPLMMLEYWKKPEATKDKYRGNYLLTGDLGSRDPQGYFTFFGRSDDVIKSAGYRIGPNEIEECLMKLSDVVENVACIGIPDPAGLRGEIVKVFIILRSSSLVQSRTHDELRQIIAAHVSNKLAKYEYPREIEFVTELPMTTTGKIIRKELKRRHMEKLKLQEEEKEKK